MKETMLWPDSIYRSSQRKNRGMNMWTDICHKCGQKIFNNIPMDHDPLTFIEEMRAKGYMIGHITESIDNNVRNIKPICKNCSDVEYTRKTYIKKRKIVNKIKLKKLYHCPCIDCNKVSDRQDEMINHLLTHNLQDLEYL